MWNTRISNAEALEQHCPKCKATPGNSCTYVDVVATTGERSAAAWEKVARVGKPTLRSHNERFSEAWQVAVRKVKREVFLHGSAAAKKRAASPQRREIARAQREYDLREYNQLVAWIRHWVHIFWE